MLDVACMYVLSTHACMHVRMYLHAVLQVRRRSVMLDNGCVLEVGHQVSRLMLIHTYVGIERVTCMYTYIHTFLTYCTVSFTVCTYVHIYIYVHTYVMYITYREDPFPVFPS